MIFTSAICWKIECKSRSQDRRKLPQSSCDERQPGHFTKDRYRIYFPPPPGRSAAKRCWQFNKSGINACLSGNIFLVCRLEKRPILTQEPRTIQTQSV